MKLAICLYGQPRNLKQGFENIKTFLEKNECKEDFYINTWSKKIFERKYKTSKWRKIEQDQLKINKNIINEIKEIYKPKKISYQKSIKFKQKNIKSSLIFKNTRKKNKENINNVLSQLYSKQKVMNLLNSLDDIEKYDFVVGTRFDFLQNINLNINELDKSKIYFSNILHPRKVLLTDFVITSPDIFFKYFNVYQNLENLINNCELKANIERLGEDFEFSAENIHTLNYLYHFKNFDNVVFTEDIPNFY